MYDLSGLSTSLDSMLNLNCVNFKNPTEIRFKPEYFSCLILIGEMIGE